MKFGIFYEHQVPRPWDDRSEHRVFHEALEQIEVADRIGILKHGKLIALGTMDELRAQHERKGIQLEEMFLDMVK